MKRTILYLALFFFGSATLMAADVPGDFNAAVRTVVKGFQQALKTKDAPQLGSYYARDAVIFPPNSDMIKGRDGIQTFWKGLMDAGMSAELETVETENQGELGFEVGRFKILSADGKTVDQGKYVVVWKKEDGVWKLYRDIWNSNMPAPQSARH